MIRLTKEVFTWKNELSEEAFELTQIPIMVKLLATVDDNGWPHLTFIAANKAKTQNQIVWGQFLHGKSKKFIQDRPKHGYLFMTIKMPFKMIQIKADFSHILKNGEDLDFWNSRDMRYSTTMNVWRAFYSNIYKNSPIQTVSLGKLLKGIIFTLLAKGATRNKNAEERLNTFGKQIFSGAMNPKFIAFLDPADNYPIIVPCFQALAADDTKLVFSPTLFKKHLEYIPKGSKIAVFGMTMDFNAQVIKGTFYGFKKYRGINLGEISIEQIYNSPPPLPGYIYPKLEVLPEITDFSMPE